MATSKRRLTKTARTGKDITFAATGDATVTVTETETTQTVTIGAAVSSGGVSDGDKGDITVSGSGTVWNIDAGAVGAAELAAAAITGQTTATADGADYVLISDTSASGALRKALASDFGGSGGAAWTEVEVDFGATPVYDATFTVTDASVTGTTEIAVVQSGGVATSRAAGDSLWDTISYAAAPGTGSFTLYAHATPGPVVGRRKILYQLGS